MTKNHKDSRKPSWLYLPLALPAGFALVVFFLLVVYRPDRPVATIVPGSSAGPAFVVQVIRPRLGLPLGGILPPQVFGLEAHLGFDSKSAGAAIRSVGPGRIELGADDWDLLLVLGADGRVASETQVVFDLVFEDRLRRVRCRPDDPAVGTLNTVTPGESGGLSGSFDIELAHCADAETGTPLGWPPEPLVLHGSFDQLPPDTGAQRQDGARWPRIIGEGRVNPRSYHGLQPTAAGGILSRPRLKPGRSVNHTEHRRTPWLEPQIQPIRFAGKL